MGKLWCKRGRTKPLWHGHPWVYSGAILREEGCEPGGVVEVLDSDGKFIGRGFYNPRSQIRVRLCTWRQEAVDDAFLQARLQSASELRRRIGLPSDATTAYRLVNSEGDGLPGLVIDLYGDVAAVQFTTLAMKQREAVIFAALPSSVVVEVAAPSATLEGFSASTRLHRGTLAAAATCRENGIDWRVDPRAGQKTGLFLDQRENRARIGQLAHGTRLLDVYSYMGGFALAALRGGASSATCVDASARALDGVHAHAELNRLPAVETVEQDAFRFLELARPKSYDLVVVDPPKFARAQKDMVAAEKGYRRLNLLGLTVCADGGLYATSSCSQLMDLPNFERMLAAAAQDAGRRVQVLEVRSQGADHPVPPAFAEGRYLKFLLCRVS